MVVKTIRLVKGQDTWNQIVHLMVSHQSSPCQFSADGGKTAQITGRADKAWAVVHANVAQLMRAAVGGGLTPLLKVSWELKLANLAVH